MKKTISILIISALLFSLFGSCKKYDEGPLISFRSKEKRLLGTWRIEHYYVNGYDSSNYFTQYDSPLIDFESDIVYFTIEDLYTLQPKKSKWLLADWSWANDMSNIMFEYQQPLFPEDEWLNTGPFIIGETVSWEIKKLKLKELVLETRYLNVSYRLEYGRF